MGITITCENTAKFHSYTIISFSNFQSVYDIFRRLYLKFGIFVEKKFVYLLSHLAKLCHYDRIDSGVAKTGSGSPFAKMSTF